MIITKIIAKNFLSFGNHPESIEIKKGLYRVIGKNGHGKSTILTDAIMFALYGKTVKKLKQSQIVNNLNKSDCEVSLEFNKGNDKWQVIRGLSPKKFSIKKNGKAVDDLSTLQLQQTWFEREVIGVSDDMMKQFVILSGRHHTPFFEMGAQQKRQFIEDVLGLSLIATYDKAAKGEIRNRKTKLAQLIGQHDEIINNIETLKSLIDKANESVNATIEKHNNTLKQIKEAEDKLSAMLDSFEHEADTSDLKNKIIEYNKQKNDIKQSIMIVHKDYEIAKTKLNELQEIIDIGDGVCPTCKQPISEHAIDEYYKEIDLLNKEIEEYKQKIIELKKEIDSIDRLIDDKEKELTTIEKTNDEIRNKRQDIERKLLVLSQKKQSIIDMIEQSKIETGVNELEDELKKAFEKKENIEKEIGDVENEIQLLLQLREVFSDDGVKSVIVANNIVFLEERIQHWLSEFGLFAIVEFDENLEETIKMQGYEEQSFSACSMGEKTRLSLSALFAFRDLVESMGVSMPKMIVLDEVIENLDDDGKRMLLDSLYNIAHDNDMGIYLISHDMGLDARFDGCYNVSKDDGFSVIKEGC